mgnify:CR=1 FL=1
MFGDSRARPIIDCGTRRACVRRERAHGTMGNKTLAVPAAVYFQPQIRHPGHVTRLDGDVEPIRNHFDSGRESGSAKNHFLAPFLIFHHF